MRLSAYYLIFLLLFLYPYSAWKSRRRRLAHGSSFPRRKMYRQTMIAQALLTALAIWVAYDNHITLFASWRPTLTGVAAGMLGLLAMIYIQKVPPLAPRKPNERTSEIAPRTPSEQAGYVAMITLAAFGEEVMYRGALFGVLALLLGHGWWPAAFISAAAFGLSHLYQGWRAVAIVLFIALIAQAVVLYSGTLYVAMLMHFVYDYAMGRKHSRRAAQLEPSGAV